MSIKLFITGTDTDVGKTYITTGILNVFNQQKCSTLGIKPVASGCTLINGVLQNADALALQNVSSIKLPYHQINPIALEPAIAPHIAAAQKNHKITLHELKEKTQYALQYPADICLVEGAGGWYTPLNDEETMADYVKAIELKVILVVGIRLGCINHAILTYKAIKQHKISVAGWIANCIDPTMQAYNENIACIKKFLPTPYLGRVDYGETVLEAIRGTHFLNFLKVT